MKRLQSGHRSRKGTTVVLTAIMLIPILAMVAFAVDMSYITVVQNELQNSADAAALAGASQLLVPQVPGTSVTSLDTAAKEAAVNATNEAKTFAKANRGGGVYLTLLDRDITVGSSSGTGLLQKLLPWSPGRAFPNTVEVTVRRDTSANGPLNLFFAPVIGTKNWNGTATARAEVDLSASRVTGFKSWNGGPNSLLLPIAIDIEYWNTFLQSGKGPDGMVQDNYTVKLPLSGRSGDVESGPDSVPEFNDVYPNKHKPGNFGLVDIGPPANNTPAFREWIANGPSPSDLDYFGPEGLQATPDKPATLKGGPGLKSTLQSDLEAIIGKPRIVPLFSKYYGNGQNMKYEIVGFAGITIVKAEGRGNNMAIWAQPVVVVDPTATTGGSITTYSSFVYRYAPISLTR